MGPNVAILSVITKDLPISPQFTPYEFVKQWLSFTYSCSNAFRYRRKDKNPALTSIDFPTSALAGYCVQVTYYSSLRLDHSGNEGYSIIVAACRGVCKSSGKANRTA